MTATVTKAAFTAKDAEGKMNVVNLEDFTFTITVIPILARSISLDKNSIDFSAAGQSTTIVATVLPENVSNKEVTWTSSNTEVATVSNTGVVTAVGNGTASISATTKDGTNLSASCEVIVDNGIWPDTDISTLDNALFVEPDEMVAGQRYCLPILLKNCLDVAGVSFTLKLPEGMTLLKDDNNDFVYELNGERAKDTKFAVFSNELEDRTFGFRIMPTGTNTITGTEGAILTLVVKVASGIETGEYQVILQSNNLTVKSSEGELSTLKLVDTRTTMNIRDNEPGDMNSDGAIDLTDAIMIVYYSLNLEQAGFFKAVADVNNDGIIDLTDAIIVVYKSLGVQ